LLRVRQFAERGMSLICPVCFWEDDAFIGNERNEHSVCNKMTLRQARANFIEVGACDAKMVVHVLPACDRGRFRSEPLSPPEVEA
jgi:Cysteine-rich CPCC